MAANLTLDSKAFEESLNDVERVKLPLLQKITLEKLVYEIYDAQRAKMSQVFDRPTPYTMNALRRKFPKQTDLVGEVWFKDDTFKGTPAPKYLFPQVYGGKRNLKRHEKALRARGILPVGWWVVPGPDAKFDAYGNQGRGEIVRVLSFLGAFAEGGYRANINAEKKARIAAQSMDYFVVSPGDFSRRKGGLTAPGIWKRNGKSRKPSLIMRFVREPHYTPRYPFHEVSEQTVKTKFVEKARQAYEKVFVRK